MKNVNLYVFTYMYTYRYIRDVHIYILINQGSYHFREER